MRNNAKIILCFVFMLLYIFSTACTKEQSETIKLTELKICQSQHSLLFLPLYLSNELGFFKNQGLNILIKTADSQESALKSLLSEDASLFIGSPEIAFYHIQQGNQKPIVFIAQTASKSGYYLITRDNKKPFSWQNLKGKSIIGCNNGELPQVLFEYLLKKNNLKPFLDVHIIQNLPHRLIEGSFLAGTGNYLLATEPMVSRIEKGTDSIIATAIDISSDPLVTTAIMTTSDYLENNPVVCQGFVKALQEGLDWINEHTPEEIVDTGKKFFPDENEKILLRAVSRYKTLGCWPDSTDIVIDGIKSLHEIMLEKKELNSNLTFEQLNYSSLIQSDSDSSQ